MSSAHQACASHQPHCSCSPRPPHLPLSQRCSELRSQSLTGCSDACLPYRHVPCDLMHSLRSTPSGLQCKASLIKSSAQGTGVTAHVGTSPADQACEEPHCTSDVSPPLPGHRRCWHGSDSVQGLCRAPPGGLRHQRPRRGGWTCHCSPLGLALSYRTGPQLSTSLHAERTRQVCSNGSANVCRHVRGG